MSFQSRETKSIRFFKWISIGIAAVALIFVVLMIALYVAVRGSLPTLDGTSKIASTEKITVTRDSNGTVAINATNQLDATRALGFIHAQERFFEMDLARRAAAGELSALLGKATVKMDQEKRVHRFRTRLTNALPTLSADERSLIAAYTSGVNAGLSALSVRPWQYLALRATPEPWQEVDSLLVIAEMYAMLQGRAIENAFGDAILREKVGDKIFQWLKPRGGEWDAALDDSVMPNNPMPNANELDTRKASEAKTIMNADATKIETEMATEIAAENYVGSNAWAVSGALTAHGGAMLSNDMHLGLQVPNIWFRAQITVGASDESKKSKTIVGVTLPGIPLIVAGSNGSVAWGYTNSYGRWFDWLPVGDLPMKEMTETIVVKGGEAVRLKIRETDLGPVAKSVEEKSYVLAWMAHRPNAINLKMSSLMTANNVDDAIKAAQGAGMPAQNFFLADSAGNAAWTIAGLMPQRTNVSLDSPAAGFADASTAALLPLPAGEYPVIKNPSGHRLWSGNNRQLGSASGALIGEGGFDLGARGRQIRDRLRASGKFSEQTLLDIQYDNEALFLKRWAAIIRFADVENAKPETISVNNAIKNWNGKADIDQVGYRFVRGVRAKIHEELWKAWLTSLDPALLKLPVAPSRLEYAVWQAINEKPAHLLPKPYATWEDFIQVQTAAVRYELIKANGTIEAATWGARNKAAIKHPFSRIVPALAPYLDMPATPLAGDTNMPAVAQPNFGASQRLSVSPGREKDGILTMPGGQSGHPLSPFYGAGHQDWLNQKLTPLLAGATVHTLVFEGK
jgi:penicillin G amidase